MKKYILVISNKHEVTKSEVMNHYTYEDNLGLAFKEVLLNLWPLEEKHPTFDWDRIKGFDNKLGIDFEEESYLFFEDKIKLENIK